MGPVSGIAVYFMIWWTLLFIVLPWGVSRQDDAVDKVPGADPGAPQHNNIKLKFLITTGISAIVWLIIFFLIRSDLISFQRIAEGLRLP